MPKNLTYEALLVMVHEIICIVLNNCVYELISLLNTNSKTTIFKIKNDRDVQYMLGEEYEILKVYVTIQHSQQPSNVNQSVHAQSFHEPNHQSFVHHEWNEIYQPTYHNFVQLMAFQFAPKSGSNPFFDPNMYTKTGPEQHMNKSTIYSIDEPIEARHFRNFINLPKKVNKELM